MTVEASGPRWALTLYVSGASPRSSEAIVTVRRICDEDLAGQVDLQHAPPVLDRGVDDVTRVPDTGVVEQDIQPSVGGHHGEIGAIFAGQAGECPAFGGPAAEQQIQRVREHGLARPRLAGQHVQPRREP